MKRRHQAEEISRIIRELEQGSQRLKKIVASLGF